MDKNNLSVQASLDASQLKKDLDKVKGEVKLNADTKSLKKQVESVLKNMTIQPSLDTSQLKNDLGKFTGEVRLNANTTTLAKQVEAAIANASQNATANIHCTLSGMDSVIGQIKNVTSLNNDIKLNVSVDTSGLQQYTNQLKEIAQLSSNLQMPPLNTTAALAEASLPKTSISASSSVSAPAASIKEAAAESKGFLDTLDQIMSVANKPLSLFQSGTDMIQGYQAMGSNLMKNLD